MDNFEHYTWKHIPTALSEFHIFKTTPLSNITTQTFLRPLKNTNHIVINGGFFEATEGYDKPPTGGSSIVYLPGDENSNVTYIGRTLPKITRKIRMSAVMKFLAKQQCFIVMLKMFFK